MNSRLLRVGIVGITLALGLIGGPVARGVEEVRDTQEELAKELQSTVAKIVSWIKNRNDDGSIKISSFEIIPANLNSTNGNLVHQALKEAIAEKLTIKPSAKYTLKGDVSLEIKDRMGWAVISIEVIGMGVREPFPFETNNSRLIDVLFGNTIAHRPESSRRNIESADRVLDRTLSSRESAPNITKNETRVEIADVLDNRKPDFSLEIAVRDRGAGEYIPRRISLGNGDDLSKSSPFVRIRENEEYEIRLFNHDKLYDAFVEVLVDGVNVNHFYNADLGKAFLPRERISHWMVNRASKDGPGTQFISGWQRNSRDANRFLVKQFPEGAAAQLGLSESEKTGTITVSYRKAWMTGENAAQSESTSVGDLFENTTTVETREVGQVRGTICIRYAAE